MREDSFRQWMMAEGTMQKRPMDDAVSRCGRLENELGVSLDKEYEADGGQGVIDRLVYTREDQRQGRPAPAGLSIPKGANIYNAVASLRSAARKYFKFCGAGKQ